MTWTAIVACAGEFSRKILHEGSHDPNVVWQYLSRTHIFNEQEAIICIIPGNHTPWAPAE